MTHDFKIWNQGNDGQTMAVRVADSDELEAFSRSCHEADLGGHYASLKEYLEGAAMAANPPIPYNRLVDVVWLSPLGYGVPRVFHGRTLVATYTGQARQSGGFSCQCYCIVDPAGFAVLGAHHGTSIQVTYVAQAHRDTLIVQS